jgi:hypothetical protein
MIKAKTGKWFVENPQRARSNNSVLLLRSQTKKEDFVEIMKSVKEYGEPGFIWAEDLESLFNPCGEVNLYAYDANGNSGWEMCNLAEINGKKVKCKEDFALAARAASIIGTLQAGYTSFPYLGEVTERIVRREALLGVSITGMMDNPESIMASDVGTSNKLVNQLNALAEKGVPVYSNHLLMGEQAVDFNKMISDLFSGMRGRVNAETAKDIDKSIRNTAITNKDTGIVTYPYSNFVGINSDELQNWLSTLTGGNRSTFMKMMDKK